METIKITVPRTIQIGAMVYKIVLSKVLLRDEGVVGMHNPNSLIITLYEGNLPLKMEESLIHELLHAIEANFGIHIEEHETQVRAQGLLQFLKQLGIELVVT